jgi:hypothetical protein
MEKIKALIEPMLLLMLVVGLGLFCLINGIISHRVVNDLINSDNKYMAEIVEVRARKGKSTYISFSVNGNTEIYKGKRNFIAYRNSIDVGKEITVIFDQENKKYIIEDFLVTYQRDDKWMIIFGILFILVPLIGIVFFLIREFI